jgi:DNA-binding MarR family transcriptional regulator
MIDDDVRAIQSAYPRVFLACHRRHQTKRTNAHRLSERDSSLLAHLDETRALPVSLLARHLGVAPSTLSEALESLERLGFLARERPADDRRRVHVRLTARGGEAMQETSVLDTSRLRSLLARLDTSERSRARDGLELLARAASEKMAMRSRRTKRGATK